MTNIASMKAVALKEYLPIDREDSLIDVELDRPSPQGRDILIRVQAVSINPVDVKVRSPKDRKEEQYRVIGWDASGIVEAVGEGVTLFQPGDEVYYAGSITRPGSNVQFQLVDERIVGHKPKNLDWAEAAALPLTTITAWEAIYDRLGVSKNPEDNAGKSILIIGAAGGVGSIATQLANLAGLTVIGTASRKDSADWALKHGAHHIITHYDDFASQIEKLGLEAPEYIFCLNSTDKHWDNIVKALAPQGNVCSIVETKGPVDLTKLQDKSGTFAWEFMFTRPMFETKDMAAQHELLNTVAKLVEDGKVVTTLTERLSPFNAANMREAHRRVESGSMIGKLVVEGFDN
ncbi:zinc-binding alcohol dehydrogenase family protein [Paenibacillus xylanilyticus]|uniref:Zinc-type alcohol dehydrogenase-like protein n=1 Tax=Paenibacillus xylanilyticus TaxID=248903 RepID=A0A7Y6C3P1_9BACL|nr:zinc-binding alcohol dehydrogenase family protein [Paenibacillus xylanilyticus]NUU78964.1 zinc-binding alcohol dehydrogenase family protein [Paenibacillus xylanilyticus]